MKNPLTYGEYIGPDGQPMMVPVIPPDATPEEIESVVARRGRGRNDRRAGPGIAGTAQCRRQERESEVDHGEHELAEQQERSAIH